MTAGPFPPPWTVKEHTKRFFIKDANSQPLAYVYFEDGPVRQISMKRLNWDGARPIAANLAKLPRTVAAKESGRVMTLRTPADVRGPMPHSPKETGGFAIGLAADAPATQARRSPSPKSRLFDY
jgi:hypothetical protein